MPKNLVTRVRVVIEGGKWTLSFDDKEGSATRALTIDPSKEPKEIDFTFDKDGKKEARMGIYELKGDTLRIARPSRNQKPDERPKAIDGAGYVETWKRIKE